MKASKDQSSTWRWGIPGSSLAPREQSPEMASCRFERSTVEKLKGAWALSLVVAALAAVLWRIL